MKTRVAFLAIVVGLGIVYFSGCRHPPGCSQGYVPQPGYVPPNAPASSAPTYNQNYGQTNSFGSGSRNAPLMQGSGTR